MKKNAYTYPHLQDFYQRFGCVFHANNRKRGRPRRRTRFLKIIFIIITIIIIIVYASSSGNFVSSIHHRRAHSENLERSSYTHLMSAEALGREGRWEGGEWREMWFGFYNNSPMAWHYYTSLYLLFYFFIVKYRPCYLTRGDVGRSGGVTYSVRIKILGVGVSTTSNVVPIVIIRFFIR